MAVRKALALSFAQRYVAFVVQFIGTLVLARLLTPEDTGIFTVAAGIVGFAHMFRDFGVGDYLIQENELTLDRMRSAFGVTLSIAWGLAVILVLVSHPIALFYKQPGLNQLLPILAVNFLLLPFGTISFAMLTREMAFGKIFVIQTTGACIGTGVNIWMAWLGWGYMSLAFGSVAGNLATVLVLAYYRPHQLLARPSFLQWRRVGRFGVMASGNNMINELSKRAPEFLIAKWQSFSALGLFSKATGLVDLFHDAVTRAALRVALPTFAAAHRAQEPLKVSYLAFSGNFACVGFSFFCFALLYADPLILTLFGPQWMQAVPSLKILALTGMVSVLYAFSSPVLTAIGRVSDALRIASQTAPVQIISSVIAAFYSIEAVACSMLLVTVLRGYLYQRALKQHIGLNFGEALFHMHKSAAVAVISSAGAFLVKLAMPLALAAPLRLMIGATVFSALWFVCLFAFRHSLAGEVRLISARIGTTILGRPS